MSAHIDRQPAPAPGAALSALGAFDDEKKLDLEANPHVEYAQDGAGLANLEGAMLAEQEEGQMTFKQAM
jgi:hypothetical protein